MSGLRQTAMCGTCGWVGYADEEASHRCNPRRVTELELLVADLAAQVAELSGRLAKAENAWALAVGIRAGRDMITPGRPDLHLISLNSAARPAPQVTGGPGRAAKRTPGRASYARVAPLRRAPAGGVA